MNKNCWESWSWLQARWSWSMNKNIVTDGGWIICIVPSSQQCSMTACVLPSVCVVICSAYSLYSQNMFYKYFTKYLYCVSSKSCVRLPCCLLFCSLRCSSSLLPGHLHPPQVKTLWLNVLRFSLGISNVNHQNISVERTKWVSARISDSCICVDGM